MSTCNLRRTIPSVAAGILLISPLALAEVIYVDADATGAADGTSWQDAYPDLQDALAAAQSGDELWIAEGTYTPAPPGGPRTASFRLSDGITLLGGFTGTEDDPAQRNWVRNETILSGDLDGDDPDDFGSNCCYPNEWIGCDDAECEEAVCAVNYTCCLFSWGWNSYCAELASTLCNDLCQGGYRNNSYHLLTADGSGAGSVLDGLRVVAGSAEGEHPDNEGAGLYIDADGLTIVNCIFADNFSLGEGAGIFNNGSNLTIRNCSFASNWAHCGAGIRNQGANLALIDSTFVDNYATASGGGVSNAGDSATLIRCLFLNNSTDQPGAGSGEGSGGGMYNYSASPVLVNCTFIGNTATFGGGMYCSTNGQPMLTNCTFVANDAHYGGGMTSIGDSNPLLSNCTFSGNTATVQGGGVDIWADATINNCILWANSADGATDEAAQISLYLGGTVSVNYSCVMGLTGDLGGTGNISADPLFVDPLGDDGIAGTQDDDLRLSPGSPCIDAADNDAAPADQVDLDGDGDTTEPIPFDLDGNPRFVDDAATEDTGNPGGPGPPIIDMGPYEFQVQDVPCEGDVNGDGMVDPLDIGFILARFGCLVGTGDPNCDAADQNGDGIVDPLDSGFVLARFGDCP